MLYKITILIVFPISRIATLPYFNLVYVFASFGDPVFLFLLLFGPNEVLCFVKAVYCRNSAILQKGLYDNGSIEVFYNSNAAEYIERNEK